MELFPGATRIVAMYYSPEYSGIKTIGKEFNSLNESVINQELQLTSFEKYRHQRPRYSWVEADQSENKDVNKQLQIQREYKKHSLLIRFPNASDGLSDIILVSFKNESQIFRMSENQQKLSTEMKQTVASVYVRSLDVIKKQIEDDKNIDSIIQAHRANTKSEESANIKELSRVKNLQNTLVRSILNRKTKELTHDLIINVEWDTTAIDYISEHLHSVSEIENSIEKALILALNEANENSDQIMITRMHVSSFANQNEAKSSQQVDTRYHRSISLLDRYEQAAVEVIKNKLRLTGNRLGEHMNPPISAAAISDAIRKHGSKITYLLNTYPQRWSILRSNFRPIQNKIYAPIDLEQRAS
jgi:hypothetical protein